MAVNGNERKELKIILDETGLPERNWKNEIATKMNKIATKKNFQEITGK